MAYRDEAPYRPQNAHEVAEMLRGLESKKAKCKGKGGFSCKKATFEVQGSNIAVNSWRMQDWDYKKPNLPTYARGLFTTTSAAGRTPEIAVRGYDKFFNHGEVQETEWTSMEQNTRGPYELSVKENGCIIFLAGLEDGTLLVCSKHSTGPRRDVEVSHSSVGEKWVDRHLATVGKTRQDLALKLREMNATAVAELCDDEFEEHVLEYTPANAGLYLHGINLNLPDFATYPHHLVDQFALEWGFRQTMYVVKDDLNEVKQFLDAVAVTGNYAGRDTEGFVIRCQSKANTDEWHDWFFKYKFEEPYLMYRQWRECTKAIIAGREPRYKKHKEITEKYLLFARRQLVSSNGLAKAYTNNHGIIKMRDDFLAHVGMNGADLIKQEQEAGETSDGAVIGNVILVPVATIGCGKTTVALALCKLFNWGHVQNDNITLKRGKPLAFAVACATALAEHPVMVADRNNHQRRERKQLFADVTKLLPNVRFVALHFVHDRSNYDHIREALRQRVLSRGDNHQTINTSKGEKEITSIMEGFMDRFEPVSLEEAPDDSFDLVIDLDPTIGSRQNLETVVNKLYEEFPKLFGDRDMPSADDMDEAIEAATNDYQVDVRHEIKTRDDKRSKRGGAQENGKGATSLTLGSAKPTKGRMEYFAVQLPVSQVLSVLESAFRDAATDVAAMYNGLRDRRRIQTEFHVTLIHRAAAVKHAEDWARLEELYERACAAQPDHESRNLDPVLGKCIVRLERLVWDQRIMAFVARLGPASAGVNGVEPQQQQPEFHSVSETAHVTVGTAAPDIKPKESNDLLARWLREGSGPNGIRELSFSCDTELWGTVRGILSR